MVTKRPDFLKWVVMEPDNWHLKKGAPKWAQKEFKKFMLSDEKQFKKLKATKRQEQGNERERR